MSTGGGRPAAFVDRDGTIIREREYLSDPADVELLPGAVEGLRTLSAAGFAIVVVTNQSGIARGLYDEAAYQAVQRRLVETLAGDGVRVTGSYHCPHHPDFTGACDCRKPGTGLFRRAVREHALDPARSVFIGDRLRDIEAARDLGGRAFLVRTGYGREEAKGAGKDVVVCDDLETAAAAAGRPPESVDTRGASR